MANVVKLGGFARVKAFLSFLVHHWFLTLVTFMLVAVFLGGLMGSLYSMTLGRVFNAVRGGSSAAA